MKKCTGCQQEKPLELFGRTGSRCKACKALYMKDYYQKNPDKALANRSRQVIRDAGKDRFTRHGITIGQYDIMVLRYDGKCWSCKERMATVIDHDHNCCSGQYSCGKCARGVLCMQCNTAFGLLRENVSYVENLLSYARQTS